MTDFIPYPIRISGVLKNRKSLFISIAQRKFKSSMNQQAFAENNSAVRFDFVPQLATVRFDFVPQLARHV